MTDHIERLRFNTALATLMDQLNYLAKLKPEELGRFAIETFVLMLAPMAPYSAKSSGAHSAIRLGPSRIWPKFDEA